MFLTDTANTWTDKEWKQIFKSSGAMFSFFMLLNLWLAVETKHCPSQLNNQLILLPKSLGRLKSHCWSMFVLVLSFLIHFQFTCNQVELCYLCMYVGST